MKLESRPVGNLALNLGALVAGALLMWLARDFRHGGSNELAGFLLGCLLFGLGAASFAIGESRTVELDERNKKIVLQVRRRIGSCRRVEIPFRCITGWVLPLWGARVTDPGTMIWLSARTRAGIFTCLEAVFLRGV